MFYFIDKIEQGVHYAKHLKNPKNPGNEMVLGVYRNKIRTIFHTGYTKPTFGEYWDRVNNKKIPKRLWTTEMKAFYEEKAQETAKAPFFIKLTIVGWLFIFGFIAFFAYLTYDSLRPPMAPSEEYTAMRQEFKAGDIFFGKFERMEDNELIGRITAELGFGWFKITHVDNGKVSVAKSVEMNKGYKDPATLNSIDFEEEATVTTIKNHEGYLIDLVSEDKSIEFQFTQKK